MLSQQIKGNQIHLYDKLLSISDANKEQSQIFLNKVKEDKIYTLEIKEYRKKRSLNANSFAWSILTQIAEVLRTSKEEVYIKALRDYGVNDRVYIPKDGFDSLKRAFKYSEIASETTKNGKVWADVIVTHGSSSYNTREMAHFIDMILQDAKELGITFISDEEVKSLIDSWEGYNE